MGIQLKTVGHERNLTPVVKRASAVLTDGSAVVMVVDSNQTGVSGDGGDNTGVPKAYFYHSSDRVTWTLKSTINMTSSFSHPIASMAIDNSNNLHMAWRSSTGGLTYKRLVYSAGPTYTVDADQIVSGAPAAGETVAGIDIDILGTSTTHAVVAASFQKTTSPYAKYIRSWVRNTAGTWVAQTVITYISGDYINWTNVDLSIAADQQAVAGDNIALFAISVVRGKGAITSKDFGDVIYMVKTNISTGATQGSVATAQAAFNAGLGGGKRKYWLWSSGPDKWVLGGIASSSPWKSAVMAFTWNRTTMTKTVQDIPITLGSHGTVLTNVDNTQWGTATYNKANQTVQIYGFSGNYSYVAGVILDQANKIAYPQVSSQRWDNDFKYGGALPPISVVAGANSRNTHAGSADVISFFWKGGTTFAYRYFVRSKAVSLAPTNLEPASLALIATDRPVLAARHKQSQKWAQDLYKMEWLLATDAGFTSNVRTITEPRADFIKAEFTPSPDNVIVRTTENVPAIYELFQATWFMKARTIDRYGGVGPYSATQSFTAAHPPVGANLSPRGNEIVVLTAADLMTMTWSFTDPSPSDTQTAYQVVVEVNETAASVVNTGKVSSTSKQATVTIPVAYENTVLRWRLTLWDSDDVAGPVSDWQLFTPADKPDPDITSIADAEVIITGTPVVAWTPGVTGSQVQTAYKVMVTQGVLVRHDSGWFFSASTSYTIPLGVLHNANAYTITVIVKDNFGLEASDFVSFTTAWTPPASPTGLQIYLSEYATRGFVWLVQDIGEIDPNVISYNLYRRKYGTADWELINQFTDFSGASLTFRDYQAGSGETQQYVCTQVVDSFGDIMESAITDIETYDMTPRSDRYWLLDDADVEASSLPLYAVTADSFAEEYEQETYNVIGRGRHTDYGDRFGYTGSLSCQLRDQVGHGVEHTNYALNPAMQIYEVGASALDRWSTIVQSGGTTTYYTGVSTTPDPSPTGKMLVPEMAVFDMPNGAIIWFQQELSLNELPPIVIGQTLRFSYWAYGLTPFTNAQWYSKFFVVNASETVLATTEGNDTSVVETYTANTIGTPDYLNPSNPTVGIWKRFERTFVWPAGAPNKLRLNLGIRNQSGGLLTGGFKITGAQLEIGTTRQRYVDGDQFDAAWLGVPGLAPSYTNGYYTARQQRLNLEEMKSRRRSVHIRSPFGDLFRVSTGNMNVSRIAGTGLTEFTDVEIPYAEVGE